MNLLQFFFIVEGVLLVCFCISYGIYIHYRDVVYVDFPVDFKSPEYVNNLKRESFWKFMSVTILTIMGLFFILVFFMVFGGILIERLGSIL